MADILAFKRPIKTDVSVNSYTHIAHYSCLDCDNNWVGPYNIQNGAIGNCPKCSSPMFILIEGTLVDLLPTK